MGDVAFEIAGDAARRGDRDVRCGWGWRRWAAEFVWRLRGVTLAVGLHGERAGRYLPARTAYNTTRLQAAASAVRHGPGGGAAMDGEEGAQALSPRCGPPVHSSWAALRDAEHAGTPLLACAAVRYRATHPRWVCRAGPAAVPHWAGRRQATDAPRRRGSPPSPLCRPVPHCLSGNWT